MDNICLTDNTVTGYEENEDAVFFLLMNKLKMCFSVVDGDPWSLVV